MKTFGELNAHANQHPMFGHKFNPYGNARYPSHKLDERLFKSLLENESCSCDLAHLFTGLIDAPDEVPMGASERIHTIGGYEREQYMTQNRETISWKKAAMAEAEMSAMLKEILEENENGKE